MSRNTINSGEKESKKKASRIIKDRDEVNNKISKLFKKKSEKELFNQVKWFLDSQKKYGRIESGKINEILGLLSQNINIISKENEVKKCLLGILSEDEYDKLYGEYAKYLVGFGKVRNEIEKLNIVPDNDYLLDSFVSILLVENSDVNDLLKLIGETSSDQLKELKEMIKKCISNVERMFPGVDYSEIDGKIIFSSERSEPNINVLREFGIDGIDNFNKLADVINYDDSVRIRKNLTMLRNLGIDGVDDLSKLQKLITYYDTTEVELNILLLKDFGINTGENLSKFENLIMNGDTKIIRKNLLMFKGLGIDGVENFSKLQNLLICGESDLIKENILVLRELGIDKIDDILQLENLIKYTNSDDIKSNILALRELGIDRIEDFSKLESLIKYASADNIKSNILALRELGIDGIEDFLRLEVLIRNSYPQRIKSNILALRELGIDRIEDFSKLEIIIQSTDADTIKSNIIALRELGIDGIDNFSDLSSLIIDGSLVFNEKNHKGYSKYAKEVIDFKISDKEKAGLFSNVLRLSFDNIDFYLEKFKEFCIEKKHSYSEFLKFFDGRKFNLNLMDFSSRGFVTDGIDRSDNVGILNCSIKMLYPDLNIEFNERETEKILGFIDSIGGINKGYTILVLVIEKMVRDGVNGNDFNYMLCKTLEKYKKVLDMYPEDKIPDGLKISVGLEFEMTRTYLNWYKATTGKDYEFVVYDIVNKAKVGIENEGVYEFATKPSTNPMVALLEIHLLQELNLLDINDMQKFSLDTGNVGSTNYKSRNGTGYHLNIGSDSDIGVDENIYFIQTLSTILPRSGISNGDNVKKINPYSNINSKASNFSVFPNSESKKYVELRTYSVDDVEFLEKNVLFNTYAIMGSQAQKKTSKIGPKTIIELRKNNKINTSNDLMKFLESNNLFDDNQDLKSKKIAVEFIFMQITVLRAIHDYNKNFINNELFGIDEISGNLSESWRNYFMDLLCLDNGESIGYNDDGQSSRFVKFKCKKLYSAFASGSFDFNKYLEKDEPFSDDETRKILDEYGEVIDESKTSLITIRLNKRLLWEKLIISCDDTQDLEGLISDKKENINRIKSYVRGNNPNLKIDRKYLSNYFKTNMSLGQYNPYNGIDTDFMNKIINLNNFFLKKDDTNANGVLQTTILNGDKEREEDISKSSIFETGGYMRKGYNYYQGGTENMLLHTVQKIALNYMDNVKNILNTDYENGSESSMLAKAA